MIPAPVIDELDEIRSAFTAAAIPGPQSIPQVCLTIAIDRARAATAAGLALH